MVIRYIGKYFKMNCAGAERDEKIAESHNREVFVDFSTFLEQAGGFHSVGGTSSASDFQSVNGNCF